MTRINETHLGWWCPDCKRDICVGAVTRSTPAIPVFRPLDVPEPCEVDEVEEMEADVLTADLLAGGPNGATFAVVSVDQRMIYWPENGLRKWSVYINDIARASAKARAGKAARGAATSDALMGVFGAKRVKP